MTDPSTSHSDVSPVSPRVMACSAPPSPACQGLTEYSLLPLAEVIRDQHKSTDLTSFHSSCVGKRVPWLVRFPRSRLLPFHGY